MPKAHRRDELNENGWEIKVSMRGTRKHRDERDSCIMEDAADLLGSNWDKSSVIEACEGEYCGRCARTCERMSIRKEGW